MEKNAFGTGICCFWGAKHDDKKDDNIHALQRKIGELTMQVDFLKKALGQ